ncbi:MAG: AI-2E family transporter [Sporolactobacillus sp.]
MAKTNPKCPNMMCGVICRAAAVGWLTILFSAALVIAFQHAMPFILACLAAFYLHPFIVLCSKRLGIARAPTAAVILFTFGSACIGLAELLIKGLEAAIDSIGTGALERTRILFEKLHDLILTGILPFIEQSLGPASAIPSPAASVFETKGIPTTIMAFLTDALSRLQESLHGMAHTMPNTLISAFILFFTAFLIAKDANQMTAYCLRLVAPDVRPVLLQICGELDRALRQFVRAQAACMALTILVSAACLLTLRQPHALLIAVAAGVLDLIPYLGSSVLFACLLIERLTTGDFPLAAVFAAICAATLVQRRLLSARFFSGNAGIDPLIALTALYLGFRFNGFAGLVFAPLVLVAARSLIQSRTLPLLWRYIKSGRP